MGKSTIKINELRTVMTRASAIMLLVIVMSISAMAQTTDVVTTSGTWTVPLGVTSVIVGCYGGGGGGGGAYANACTSGSGGGGGAFSTQTLAVSPGQVYNVTIGAGGNGGSSSGVNGTAGGTTTFSGIGGTCSADGGLGGISSKSNDFGNTKPGVSGGTSGTGFLYAGGNSGTTYHGSWSGSSGGGGGAGNGGAGGNSPGGNSSAAGIGGAGTYPGGAGGVGYCCNGNNSNGRPGVAPGGGGSGAATASCSGGGGYVGGAGAKGQVILTYTINPVCTTCPKWFNMDCTTSSSGSYIDGGTISPMRTLQIANTATTTSNYGYVFWSFNASADSTYYFDLCYSSGTAGSSWLRIHNARNTSPGNNYCMDTSSTPTLILQNRDNGCAGTGTGLSKLIWTCQTNGTYYIETAVNAYPTYWGVSSNQTATLSYKTLPSFSVTCSDVFYDKGIDGTNGSVSNYNNDEDWIYTYYPSDTVADAINIQFTSFSTSAGDQLCVFNGNSIHAPLIGCYGGPSITGAFSSTANDGSLTFHFTSDDTLTSTGWRADVSCVASLHVNNYASANEIRIFPNPVSDKLEILGLKFDANTKIQVFDVTGKSIIIREPVNQSAIGSSQSKTVVDVSSVSSGIYLIRIENEKGIWNGKFVKQ